MSHIGTKHALSSVRLKARNLADSRPSLLKVGLPPDGRPDSEGSRMHVRDPLLT